MITPGGTTISLPTPSNIASWINNTATSGTDTTNAANTLYYASLFVPGNCLITDIVYLIGSVGGTDKVIAGLFDQGGNALAWSTLAGTTVGTDETDMVLPLTQPYNYIGGPGILFVGLLFNGTTAHTQTIPAYCSGGGVTGSVTTWAPSGAISFTALGTATALPGFTPSATAFTANTGPIAHFR